MPTRLRASIATSASGCSWATPLVILTLPWFGSGRLSLAGRAAINGLGRLASLLGGYLVPWQLLLMSRLPWLHRAIGTPIRPEGLRTRSAHIDAVSGATCVSGAHIGSPATALHRAER